MISLSRIAALSAERLSCRVPSPTDSKIVHATAKTDRTPCFTFITSLGQTGQIPTDLALEFLKALHCYDSASSFPANVTFGEILD